MYIAHLNKKGEVQELSTHLKNTAFFASYFGKKFGLENTMYLIGIIHDMGKLRDSFQKKIKQTINNSDVKPENDYVDHAVAGAKYIYNMYGGGGKPEEITAEIIALATTYHHGGLKDCVSDDKILLLSRFDNIDESELSTVIERFSNILPDVDIDAFFKSSCEEIKAILTSINKNTKEKNGFIQSLFIKTIYSMLIDADRLDTALFEDGITDIKDYILHKSDNTDWKRYADLLEDYLSNLKNKKIDDTKIKRVNEIRKSISDECLCASKRPTGLFKLTVPTGGGKTLGSLRFAVNHCLKQNLDRIIYVMPMNIIIEQNADVVRRAIKDCDLLENHTNVLDDKKGKDYDLLATRWDSRIVFTSMVQYLNSFYGRGTQHIRRIHNMSNSVIIFDEVQKLPAKCINLFNSSINYLVNICGSSVVLCTATQPALGSTKIPIDGLNDDNEITEDVTEKFKLLERVDIIDKRKGRGISIEEAAEFINEKKKIYRSLLIVANKVDSAERLYDSIKQISDKETHLFFLSSHLCPKHRKEQLDGLMALLKKKESVICVSTQVIEAGVDISFDAAVRCLAGLDSIAQVAGRVNRNGELEKGACFIIKLNSNDENLGKLQEIQVGARHCEDLLNEYKKNPKKYDNNLLSPMAINQYYDSYFSDCEISKQAAFPITKQGEYVYKMLCCDSKNKKGYEGITGKKYPLNFYYAFNTAANEFAVIDNNSRIVVVPYGNGKILTEQMLNEHKFLSFNEKEKMIRDISPYCVNIQSYQFTDIEKKGGIIYSDEFGVNILSEIFYDKEKGVIKEGNSNVLYY